MRSDKSGSFQNMYRIVDANLNRSREGLRVVEDIVRFLLNDKKITAELKLIRHKISRSVKNVELLLESRYSTGDVGKEYREKIEGRKRNIKELAVANFKRVEESLRVLEDVSKIVLPEKTAVYKKIRFKIYQLEKKVCERL